MRLDQEQVNEIERQTGAQPIADENPAMDALKENFGDHSFYVSETGLIVWEWADSPETPSQPVVGVQIAAWADESKSRIVPHEPKATNLVLPLAPDGEGVGASPQA